MKYIFKTISMFAVIALATVSCSKWTEQQSLEFKHMTAQEKFPEQYEAYLEAIRAYHASDDHQLTIVRFDNAEGLPVSAAYHLTNLPDSCDYVILNGTFVDESLTKEINTIRTDKGIKTLNSVDYAVIRKAYTEHEKEYFELNPEATEADITPEAWVEAAAKEAVKMAKVNKLDGITVSFSAKNPLAMPEAELEAEASIEAAFIAPFVEYFEADKDAVCFFEGTANYLISKDILEYSKYIIVPAESETTFVGLNYAVNKVVGEGVPTDRFIIGVTAFDVTDETATDGVFSTATSAIVGAAEWSVLNDQSYDKCGICVNHAQFDYFHMGANWSEIRTAIATMNPSLLK